jgi:hypothetical protein
LKQYREVVPRFDTIDPIKQFATIFTIQNGLDFNYACAIRQSGRFDLYFNGFRIFSSPDDVLATEASMSYDTLYLRMADAKGTLKSIDMKHQSRMSMENSDIERNTFNYNTIFYQKIKRHCKIFNSFCLVRTYVIVVHGNILSEYHILKPKDNWVKHI